MTKHQTGITDELTPHARYLRFQLRPGADPRSELDTLANAPPNDAVIGLGQTLISGIGAQVAGLRELAASGHHGISIASTPAALWIWLRGTDRGALLLVGQQVTEALAKGFVLEDATDGFVYREGRDLTGYVDGTENPKADEALAAAIVSGAGRGLDGGSFVAVQRWQHNLAGFRALDASSRDAIIGRRISDNAEFDDAPASAHVKRAAQESFHPEAFMLRRSIPWADQRGEGLVFVAFGKSVDAFEAVLARMTGTEDGITDGLFRFTRPVTGSYFWCPPMKGTRLDLSAINL